jgi:hypothetical protein
VSAAGSWRARLLGLGALSTLALVVRARAESLPPGKYSSSGRVVRTARGEIRLFNGNGGLRLPTSDLQRVLAPHLGELIRVDYTRVEAKKEGDLSDPSGASIGSIDKVTRLANDVRVTVRPEAPRFSIADPVRVEVTLENGGDEAVELDLRFGSCNLLQDYDWAAPSLEAEGHGSNGRPYGLPSPHRLGPGETLRFRIESAWIVKAGSYDVVFTLPRADEVYLSSDPVRIEIQGEETLASLRAWLPRASPTERIRIAERLLALGDDRGVAVVLGLLDAPEGIHSHAPIYRFLWAHGGEEVERRLLESAAHAGNQASAGAILEEVHRSPRAIALLDRLLDDRRETWGDISGWCERPRICDITAAWLTGYAVDAMPFPHNGTASERDAAVASVRKTLREDPQRFSVLAGKE